MPAARRGRSRKRSHLARYGPFRGVPALGPTLPRLSRSSFSRGEGGGRTNEETSGSPTSRMAAGVPRIPASDSRSPQPGALFSLRPTPHTSLHPRASARAARSRLPKRRWPSWRPPSSAPSAATTTPSPASCAPLSRDCVPGARRTLLPFPLSPFPSLRRPLPRQTSACPSKSLIHATFGCLQSPAACC